MPQPKTLTPAQRRQVFKAAYPILRSPYGGMSVNHKDYGAGQFLPVRRHQAYSKSTCDHACGCTKCAATQAIDRVLYSRRERQRYSRIQRILYESRLPDHPPDATNNGPYGSWIPRWRPQVTPAEFIAARNNTKYPGFLSPLAEDEIKQHKLILSHDATVGAALSPEGDIQNVFNNSGPKGAGVEAILELMRQGGHTLDAFDHFLPGLYSQLGFKETGRVKFNRDYAPAGWNYQSHGEPDVVFMARDQNEPIHEDEIRRRVHDRSSWQPHQVVGQYFDDWDRAKAHSRGGGIPGTHDPGAGPGLGGSELASPARERQGSGLPLTLASQAHMRSQDPRTPLRETIRTIHAALPPPRPTQSNILEQIRSKRVDPHKTTPGSEIK